MAGRSGGQAAARSVARDREGAGDGRSVVGSSTVGRVASRLESGALQRQSMPGGGSVYRGELAQRALKSVGARAMTLDRQIIVADDFNPSNPEDQALYAHEAFHAQHGDGGGGGGGENFRDAEEVAARAVERMVFHRMEGGYEGGYQPHAGAGHGDPHNSSEKGGSSVGGAAGGAAGKPETIASKSDPVRGYRAMIAQGYSHLDVVDDLARRVLGSMDDHSQSQLDRHADKKGTIV